MTALFTCVNEPTKEVKHKIDRVRKSSSFFHLQRDVPYISVIPAFLHVTWLPQCPERPRQHSKGRWEPWCVQAPPSWDNPGHSWTRGGGSWHPSSQKGNHSFTQRPTQSHQMGTVFCHCLSRMENSSPAFCAINFMLRAQQSQKTLKSHLLVKYKKHLSEAKSVKEMLNCTLSWQNLRLRLQEKTLAVKVHKIYPNLSDYFLRKSPFELLFNRRTNV